MTKIYLLPLFLFMTGIKAQAPQEYSQSFNGDQFFTSTSTSTLNAGSTFTYEAWVFLREASAYGIVAGKVFEPRGNDPFINYTLGFGDNGLRPEFVQTTGAAGSYRSAVSPSNIPLNTWTHLAAVSDNGALRLYVNGVLMASSTSAGAPNPNPGVPFGVGSGVNASFQAACCGIKGNMMQLRVWNTARTAGDISANMNTAFTGTESNLAAYYPMNESSGQTIQDKTSNALHLQRGSTNGVDASDPTPSFNGKNGEYFTYKTIAILQQSAALEDLYIIDFNNDTRLDFFVSRLVWPATIPASYANLEGFRNDGSLNFSGHNPFVGNYGTVHPRSFTTADFNADGRSDIFIADHGTDVAPFPGEKNKLFLQNAAGELVDSPANIPSQPDFSHYTTSGDIDGDGDIDIYVSNIYGEQMVGPYFLLNNGAGNFTKMNSNLPVPIQNLTDKYMSSALVDIDNDADLDLVLGAADNGNSDRDLILLNNGSGGFSAGAALPDRPGDSTWGTVGITTGDFNKDGWIDLVMSTHSPHNGNQTCMVQLLINNKNGTFSDMSANIQQSWPSTNTWIKWIEAGDLNHDGNLDLAFATHFAQSPKLYLNDGNAVFTDASSMLQLPTMNGIRSTRVRDFDNDGKTEVAFLGGDKVVIASLVNEASLSTDDNPVTEKRKLIIYPNPISSSFSVKLAPNEKLVSLEMYDLSGKLVFKSSSQSEFSVPNLVKGMYLIKVKTNHNEYISKVLKN